MTKSLFAVVALLSLVAASCLSAACELRCGLQASRSACHFSAPIHPDQAMSMSHSGCSHEAKPASADLGGGVDGKCMHPFKWAAVSDNNRANPLIYFAPQIAVVLSFTHLPASVAPQVERRLAGASPPSYLTAIDPLQTSLRL